MNYEDYLATDYFRQMFGTIDPCSLNACSTDSATTNYFAAQIRFFGRSLPEVQHSLYSSSDLCRNMVFESGHR